jgi:hypothetical protein
VRVVEHASVTIAADADEHLCSTLRFALFSSKLLAPLGRLICNSHAVLYRSLSLSASPAPDLHTRATCGREEQPGGHAVESCAGNARERVPGVGAQVRLVGLRAYPGGQPAWPCWGIGIGRSPACAAAHAQGEQDDRGPHAHHHDQDAATSRCSAVATASATQFLKMRWYETVRDGITDAN